MALPVEVNPIFEGNRYPIQRSLRFRKSVTAYLNRTFGAPTSQNTWTISFWVKRGILSSGMDLFSAGTSNRLEIILAANDTLQIADASTTFIVTNAVLRDPSSWYNIVIRANGSGAAFQVYINCVLTTNSTTNNLTTSYWNASGVVHYVGALGGFSSNYFDGYLAEIVFVDGQSLAPTSFGAYNEFGVWAAQKYGGTYGNNGFYLPFNDPTSATTLCYDRQLGYTDTSKNNWTPNNISVTAGPTYDAMTDVPPPSTIQNVAAGNYATFNPIDTSGTAGSIADGNLKLTGGSAAWYQSRCGFGMTSGKWYWEVTILSTNTSSNGITIGISNSSTLIAGYVAGSQTNTWIYNNNSSGRKNLNGTGSAYGIAYVTNDVVGVAFDADAGTLTFYVNNSSQGIAASSGLPNPAFPVVSCYGTDNVAINFGQRPFSYTPPSGFLPLNSNNLPAPTIPNGAKVMAATTYTGNATARTISPTTSGVSYGNNPLNTSFKPDFVWIKSRSNALNSGLMDSPRGPTKLLISNTTNAEQTLTDELTSFNVDGFSLGVSANGYTNYNTYTYVGWQWNAGSGSSTIPSGGSITPTGASINVSAGFSVITYTAPVGTSTDTIPHGLGVGPSFIIVKCRVTSAVYNSWGVYHSSLGATKYLELNTNVAAGTASTWWNNTAPTPSVFSVGSQFLEDNSTYVAYCWTPISQYSSFGSYTGNGSTDGPFIFTNMRPRWIMVKRTDLSEGWEILDTSRNTYNAVNSLLEANTVNAEITNTSRDTDYLSNGFKIRNSSNAMNASGGTYVYAAFAENPFKLALAR